jgi:hypothetical protein
MAHCTWKLHMMQSTELSQIHHIFIFLYAEYLNKYKTVQCYLRTYFYSVLKSL